MLTHGLSDQGANGLPRLSPPYKGQLSLVLDGRRRHQLKYNSMNPPS